MFSTVKHQLAQTLLSQAPRLTRHSLAVVPDKLKLEVIQKVLSLGLKPQLQQGELDFLKDKWVRIDVLDIGLYFELSVTQGARLLLRVPVQADVSFSANVPELLLIAAGREDPDSLFFQRKLLIEGDTELGLEVKNLLLSIELDALPKPISMAVDSLLLSLETLQAHAALPKTA